MTAAFKTSLPLVLALAFSAGAASAQTTVTVFGVADAAVRYADTERVGNLTTLASGSYSSSRFGVRGQEDLGNGLTVSFWLEQFMNLDVGSQTPAGWQRRSTASLTSKEFGELRLGRDYTPTHSNWARFDPFGYVGIGAVQLLILSATGQTPVTSAFGTAPNTVQRANNGVQYILPRNPWGVEGAFVRTFGEGGVAANDQHKAVGGRIGVAVGPVYVAIARMETKNNLTGNESFDDTALAGSYTNPAFTVSLGLRRLEYLNASQDNTLIGLRVPVGSHEFKASWNRAKWDGRVGATSIAANQADQFAVGHVYHFSKRTRLYSTLATIDNKGNSRFVLPGSPAANANGLSSKAFEIGINHEF